MKSWLLPLCSLFIFGPVFADVSGIDQYPLERRYSSSDRGFAQYWALSTRNTGTYALTFDDGPDLQKTPALLDLLKTRRVQATFFVLTEKLTPATQPLIKRMLDEGHVVASHHHAHDNSNQVDEATFKANLRLSLRKLNEAYDAAGHTFDKIFYRFPYGAYGQRRDYHHMNAMKEVSQELFADNCIQFAFWDVDTNDWLGDMTSANVFENIQAANEGGRGWAAQRVVRNGRTVYIKVPYQQAKLGGGVVLQHDIQAKTLKATEMFLDYADREGLKIVPLEEIKEYEVTKVCRFLR